MAQAQPLSHPPPPPRPRLLAAAALAALAPAAGLIAAYGYFEAYLGLYPCTLCWWQRWAQFAALGAGGAGLAAALIARAVRRRTHPDPAAHPRSALAAEKAAFGCAALAAAALAVSGGLALWHVLTEQGVVPVTVCAAPSGGLSFGEILERPPVRCDRAPWSFLGLSIAGWNLVYSLATAGLVAWLLHSAKKSGAAPEPQAEA